ncbi:hypothetical protein K439DRAFT_1357778, partial [Ramaria rubella]
NFTIILLFACDILCIIEVSVSMEHLFSSRKCTIHDLYSSMNAVTASRTIVTKE